MHHYSEGAKNSNGDGFVDPATGEERNVPLEIMAGRVAPHSARVHTWVTPYSARVHTHEARVVPVWSDPSALVACRQLGDVLIAPALCFSVRALRTIFRGNPLK